MLNPKSLCVEPGVDSIGPNMGMARSNYKMGGAIDLSAIKHADWVKPIVPIEETFNRTIGPHETVFGWVAFTLPDRQENPVERFRMHLSGSWGEFTTEVPIQPLQGNEVSDPHKGLIGVTGRCADLTNAITSDKQP